MSDKIVRKISKQHICGIYIVTNLINNKIYIGQSIDIERRWNQHKYGKGNIILRNAINKYGIENFTFNILETIDCVNKTKNEIINLLVELEQKYFNDKKPFIKNNGYNIQKTSKPNLTPNKDTDFGKKISKIKIDNNHCGKSITQYTLNGIKIKEWKSAAEIERCLGYKAENISSCCLRKQNQSHNSIWRFTNESLTKEDIIDINKSLRLSEVRQYNIQGVLINTFKNTLDASNLTGIKHSLILAACYGKPKTAYGYIWKFKNEMFVLESYTKNCNKQIKQFNLDGKLIKLWDNVKQIIINNEYSPSASKLIYEVCRKNKKAYKGYIWEWV